MHMRVAPARVAGCLIAGLIWCGFQVACTRSTDSSRGIELAWSVEPSVASTLADTIVQVTVRDSMGRPVDGARLRVEAQMSHPGMTPVLANLVGHREGVYEGRLRLTMSGDWVLVADGELANGTRVSGSHQLRAGR